MVTKFSRITIIRKKQPNKEINAEIQWLGDSLGLFNERDREKSCFRIFIELMKTSKGALSSDEVASRANLSRATVIHHLHKLIDSGLVSSSHNRYYLRNKELNKLVEDLKKDVEDTFKHMEKIAKEIDKKLK